MTRHVWVMEWIGNGRKAANGKLERDLFWIRDSNGMVVRKVLSALLNWFSCCSYVWMTTICLVDNSFLT
jgi:hypothetical protein